MVVVITCAGEKTIRPDGGFISLKKPVIFVADPKAATRLSDQYHYAHPDDFIPEQPHRKWRDVVQNECQGDERFVPAWRLYANSVYGDIWNKYRTDLYILSAGWGIVRADFKLPYYDITLSTGRNIPGFAKRKSDATYSDFNQLAKHSDEELVFFGGRSYHNLFLNLTEAFGAKRRGYYRAPLALPKPDAILIRQGCGFTPFRTNQKTNWHYTCARSALELAEADRANGQ